MADEVIDEDNNQGDFFNLITESSALVWFPMWQRISNNYHIIHAEKFEHVTEFIQTTGFFKLSMWSCYTQIKSVISNLSAHSTEM